MHLHIDVEHRHGYVVLAPRGEIDFATGPVLKEAVTDALVGGDVHVVIDLSDVDFIESTGLGALIGGRRRARALGGSMALAGPDPHILKVFQITGLDKVFSIYDDVAAATAQAVDQPDASWPSPETSQPGPL